MFFSLARRRRHRWGRWISRRLWLVWLLLMVIVLLRHLLMLIVTTVVLLLLMTMKLRLLVSLSLHSIGVALSVLIILLISVLAAIAHTLALSIVISLHSMLLMGFIHHHFVMLTVNGRCWHVLWQWLLTLSVSV